MMNFTFLGISKKKQQYIHSIGITTWQKFIDTPKIKGISDIDKKTFDSRLIKAKSDFYQDKLSYVDEAWRLYDRLKDETVFLDIEISNKREPTIIGISDGYEIKQMIKGVNLDYKELKKVLNNYKLIVTFNGSSFDIPFLKKEYPLFDNKLHIDLRHLAKKVGLVGGLKDIEKQLGIKRTTSIKHGDPALLWRMFKGSNDEHYLNLLLSYNEDDVMNLKPILLEVLKRLNRTNLLQTAYYLIRL